MTGDSLRRAIDPGAQGILREIAEERIARIGAGEATAAGAGAKAGAAQGLSLPESRRAPLVPFLRSPGLICEVKRASPSAGEIARGLDPLRQALRYADAGVPSVSILTEEGHFDGSLEDLWRVKAERPELAVLRKDFLLSEEDVEISYRAGADAVLLIAALLTPEALSRLFRRAEELGMAALVEIHDQKDLAKVRPLQPPLLGINSRDLSTFAVDALVPLGLLDSVDWPCRAVFESGISHPEQVRTAGEAGFAGALIGESVVRNPDLLPGLVAAARDYLAGPNGGARGPGGGRPDRGAGGFFWRRLAARRSAAPGPLVKICGITNGKDARLAVQLGADVLGFVFADSPRRAEPALLAELEDLDVLKVAVVVTEGALPGEVSRLLQDGWIDAVQLHGQEAPEACERPAVPYYKALRVRGPEELVGARAYTCPRVLLDHYDPKLAGGTGRQIDAAVLGSENLPRPLWLAGGLSPENVRAAIESYRPELIDASSRLEAAPGRKDPEKLKRFFFEVHHAKTP